jgi:hypothetical protein
LAIATPGIYILQSNLDKLEIVAYIQVMDEQHYLTRMPAQCPACSGDLAITRLQCLNCGTELSGLFVLSALARLGEPHASLIELFLRVRGNVKDMERELGLSYPTVRARLEEALQAAGLERPRAGDDEGLAARRKEILNRLERKEISAAQAAAQLRELHNRR